MRRSVRVRRLLQEVGERIRIIGSQNQGLPVTGERRLRPPEGAQGLAEAVWVDRLAPVDRHGTDDPGPGAPCVAGLERDDAVQVERVRMGRVEGEHAPVERIYPRPAGSMQSGGPGEQRRRIRDGNGEAEAVAPAPLLRDSGGRCHRHTFAHGSPPMPDPVTAGPAIAVSGRLLPPAQRGAATSLVPSPMVETPPA